MTEPGPVRPLLTIGHSTRPLAEFISLLRANGVTLLMDVRTRPRSRRHPQFDLESLPAALTPEGIHYRHAPALGGLRRPLPDSTNDGWPEDGLRGFADYMGSEGFTLALEDLVARARTDVVALMCAEADPSKCHRHLISDALVARGHAVRHIVGAGETRPHALTPWARVEGDRVDYPAIAPRLPGIP